MEKYSEDAELISQPQIHEIASTVTSMLCGILYDHKSLSSKTIC